MPYWFGGFFNPGGGIFFFPKKARDEKREVCFTCVHYSLSVFS